VVPARGSDRAPRHPASFAWHQSSVLIITTSPRALKRDLPCRFFTTCASPHPEMQGGLSIREPCDGVIIRAPGGAKGQETTGIRGRTGLCLFISCPAMCTKHGQGTHWSGWLDGGRSDRMILLQTNAPYCWVGVELDWHFWALRVLRVTGI
jgi:hypothetical protein